MSSARCEDNGCVTAVESDHGYDPVVRANEFYARVGRVVSHCAQMEQWVFYLAGTLDRHSLQQTHAGKHGDLLLKVCRAELAKLTDIPKSLRAEITQLLDDIDAVLKKRNVVVHSVTPWPGDPDGYAHRPLPKKQRPAQHQWIGDAYLTNEYLDTLLSEIENCLQRLYSVRPRAERVSI
jgi:hypothetical protein